MILAILWHLCCWGPCRVFIALQYSAFICVNVPQQILFFDKQQIFSVRRHLQRWRGCPGPQVSNHSEQSQHLEGENHLVIFPPPLVPRPPSTGGDIWWWLQNSSNKKSHSPEFENDYSLCLRGKILWSWTSKLCRLSLVSGIINIGHNFPDYVGQGPAVVPEAVSVLVGW